MAVAILVIAACGLGQPAVAQAPALKIVVLEGEDAVNIIQQKTAVNPIVEVRDRNNLPVPGATVTFSIGGQGATFGGGLQTLTVTTDAAGQAAATGLTPTAAGPLQIQVAASYQGIAATATIVQTVVATVAQATAGGGAAAAGAGAAGGGGLGTGAIIGIVAGAVAVAGGAVVVGGASDPGAEERRNGFNGPAGMVPLPGCQFAVSPTLLTVPIEGGTFVVTVAVSPSPRANPSWIVTHVPGFVSVDKTSATGNGTVTVVVAPFTPTATGPARTTAIGIANTVMHINQPRPIG